MIISIKFMNRKMPKVKNHVLSIAFERQKVIIGVAMIRVRSYNVAMLAMVSM